MSRAEVHALRRSSIVGRVSRFVDAGVRGNPARRAKPDKRGCTLGAVQSPRLPLSA